MKQALVMIADAHINSKVALAPPITLDDDGNETASNSIQMWLWHTWGRFLEDIKRKTDNIYTNIIFNGDMIDLDIKNRSSQMMSNNPVVVLEMATKVLDPLVEIADKLFVIRGTEAHTGNSGWMEELLAQHYPKSVIEPITKNSSWWHLRADFSDVKLDIAHHVSMGNLPWTYPAAVHRFVQETRLNYLEWEEQPPDLLVRAHRHQHVDTGTTHKTRGITLPCWQWHNAYLYRLGKENSKPHIGGCLAICNDGEVEYHPFLYQPKRSAEWTNPSIPKK